MRVHSTFWSSCNWTSTWACDVDACIQLLGFPRVVGNALQPWDSSCKWLFADAQGFLAVPVLAESCLC